MQPDRRRLRILPSSCGIVRSQPAFVPRRELPSRGTCTQARPNLLQILAYDGSHRLFLSICSHGPGRPGGCSAGHDERPGCSIPAKAVLTPGAICILGALFPGLRSARYVPTHPLPHRFHVILRPRSATSCRHSPCENAPIRDPVIAPDGVRIFSDEIGPYPTSTDLTRMQAHLLKVLPEADAPSPTAVAVCGDPAVEIVKLAGSLPADLIVLGARGRRSRRRNVRLSCGKYCATLLRRSSRCHTRGGLPLQQARRFFGGSFLCN